MWRKSIHTVMLKNIFFQKLCRLWDNVEKYCRRGHTTDDNIIWRMCIAFWVPKATNTHSEYVILIAFPLQQKLHECALVLHCVYIACHVKSLCSFTPLLAQNLCSIVILEEPCWTVWGSNPVRGKKLYSFPKYPVGFVGPYRTLIHWYWGCFPGVKWLGCEEDHWPLSSAFIAWPRKPFPFVILECMYILAQNDYVTFLIF